jgi:hypothetical protein
MPFKLSKIFTMQTIVIGVCLLFAIGLGSALAIEGDHQVLFLPGETSSGHKLFEASCRSCHEGFKPVSNETCNRCHEAELVEDTHGTKKFRDPRWAELTERIDVLTCTACHNEHVHIFSRGVHLQADFCMACHEGIIQGDLKSHDGFAPDGCWTAGCHNFHDHRSISTGFLRSNLDHPPHLPEPIALERKVETTVNTVPTPDLTESSFQGAL